MRGKNNLLKLLKFDRFISNAYKNYNLIGIDEVGRGALAGPVIACAFFWKIDLKNILQYLKYIQPIKSFIEHSTGFTIFDSLKSEVKSFSKTADFKKVDDFLKLFYKLFLYSVIGVFAKIISKILKL